MQQLREIQKCVEEELETNYAARTNDNVLILGVLKRFGVSPSLSFKEIVEIKGLPSFESITRAMRKIQAEKPNLKDKVATEIRKEQEEKYIEYARNC